MTPDALVATVFLSIVSGIALGVFVVLVTIGRRATTRLKHVESENANILGIRKTFDDMLRRIKQLETTLYGSPRP